MCGAEARYHLARKAIPFASGPVQVGRRMYFGLGSILRRCSYPSTSVAQHDAEDWSWPSCCLPQAERCHYCTYVKSM